MHAGYEPRTWTSAELGWTLHRTDSFANADVSGATFSIAGVTWTFGDKTNGTWASDDDGISVVPNVSTVITAAPRVYALLTDLISGLDFNATPEVLIVVDFPAAANLANSVTLATDNHDYMQGIGDNDFDQSCRGTVGTSTTAPSGQGVIAVRRVSGSESVKKVAVTNDTVFAIALRVTGGVGGCVQAYYHTSEAPAVDLAMTGWTECGLKMTSVVQNPGTAGTALNVLLGAMRGSTSASFTAAWKQIRIYTSAVV